MLHYDYAILGGGAAGLSLLCHLQRAGLTNGARILIVEPEQKNKHDRTWSFWERNPGPFEEIVCHRWTTIGVHNDTSQRTYQLPPLEYKQIKSNDFYAYCDHLIQSLPNVTRINARAEHIQPQENQVHFSVNGQLYAANWAFSSLPHPVSHNKIKQPYLDQHFRGWFIKTEQEVFDPAHATLMDFRTPQHGETRFLYVLPTSTTEAMVEVAIFSNNHLQKEAYDNIIGDYLRQHWHLSHREATSALLSSPANGYFEVSHTEQGNIPMTTYPFPRQNGHLIYIGLGGGYARPSTGYTFYNMQRQLADLVQQLTTTNTTALNANKPWSTRHMLYDATLLDILQRNTLPGAELFPELFHKNPTPRVLDFLNGNTSLLDELQLMATTNIAVFGAAFTRQLLR